MEGVLVSAKRDGSPLTITVVTDATGHYGFPADRLASGHYTLTIRAIGYELSRPAAADVEAEQPATADLALAPVADISGQLTSTEWFISMPGTAEQKRPLIECMSCHTLERVVRSKFTADEFVGVLKRMANFANNSTTVHPQPRMVERPVPDDRARKVAEYLSTVNLSKTERWEYPLKALPRPKGRATHVIITEYDMPRPTIAPHDVRADAQGFIWYSNFVEPYLGRLDPRTGAHEEFRYPLAKPTFPAGALALEPDHDGNWWLALMFQGGLMKFDVHTKTFRHYPLPPNLDSDTAQQSMVMPRQSQVDGKVWTNDVNSHSILRLDLATGNYETVDPFKDMPVGRNHSPYGMMADKDNNLFFMDFGDESIGRVDAKTFRGTIYQTPTPRSRPRRTMLDDGRPSVVRRVRGEQARHVRHRARELQGVGRADAANLPLRRLSRQERRAVERLDVERPRAPLRSAHRHLGRVSPAAPDQCAPHLHRRHHHAGDVLGRQQSPRRYRQARAAGLDLRRAARAPGHSSAAPTSRVSSPGLTGQSSNPCAVDVAEALP